MKKVFATPDNGHYFFGYYDKSPLDLPNDRLLACRSSFIDRMPRANDSITIGYFNWRDSGDFIKVATTKAWNWQQGCMLQWRNGEGDQDEIMYNDIRDHRFVTVILNLVTMREKLLPMAYYASAHSGKFVMCIDNERHYFHRDGYNYQGIENSEKAAPLLRSDGIWKIEVDTCKTNKIIDLDTLVNHKPISNMKGAVHYVEHLMLNPSDSRCIFMHRWKTKESGVYSRLYSIDIDGSNLYLLSDSGRMSHYSWRSDNEIIAWGGVSNPVNTLRKYKSIVKYFIKPLMPLYKKLSKGNSVEGNSKFSRAISGDSYLLFTDKTTKVKRLFGNILDRDGHPSFSPINDSLMVTDTYPDGSNEHKQKLFLVDADREELKSTICLNHIPFLSKGGARCDLHPKWSFDGKYVCVDTLDLGLRSMYLYEI